ncbi:MAG: BolA/IbaG family iron-sulfur metabolism protein [Alphaproteobacteria bacterium]|nr:MAG: BolA/IbaG family iron-sulfur metabolism protein [Alphaproteobacteria bacterium]
MKQQVYEKILQHLPDAQIQVAGDDYHVTLSVKDKCFNNLSRIEQHQKIYAILGSWVGNEIHALSLKIEGTRDE